MQKWEYKSVLFDARSWFSGGGFDTESIAKELNRLGQDGWELVSMFDTNEKFGESDAVIALMKRPIAG